ncbi:hypothetical protein EAX61_07415 [Dokdonia sinensis]|uniref:Uncharacterized protein n=1 Tax=Dokdonia sinensis TaxID=2479847 RepID=A0A3M0GE30_9FLAO|nr:hypothetical protein [Dokdonia sinensis]RMB59409.1 hypothetical protein EAX61_07415 [Dokdonia sinensis]
MKTIFYVAAFALCTVGATQAQEKSMEDKVEETSTVRTTVKTALGNETVTKKTTTTKVTDKMLDPADAGKTNQRLIAANTKVRTETTYTFDDADFKLTETPSGFTVTQSNDNNSAQVATLTKLARGDVYLMRAGDETSVSYFDKDGNLVSEKYDDEKDTMTIIKYEVKRPMTAKSEKIRK